MTIRELIEVLVISTFLGFLVSFIGINLGTGCEDWSKPNCVTPKQMVEILFK